MVDNTEPSTEEEIDGALVDDNAIDARMVKPVSKRTKRSWDWNPRRKDTGIYKPSQPYRRGEEVKE